MGRSSDLKASYLKLIPGLGSHLDFAEAKSLISFLSESSKLPIKLILRGQVGGIELFISFNKSNLTLIKDHISSLNSKLTTKIVKSSELKLQPTTKTYLKLGRHYALPLYLLSQDSQLSHQQLMRHLINLEPNESVSLELDATLYTPIKARLLRKRLINGYEPYLARPNLKAKTYHVIISLLRLGTTLAKLSFKLLKTFSLDSSYRVRNNKFSKITDENILRLLDKLYSPMYKTNLVLRVKSKSPKRSLQISDQIILALNGLAKTCGDQVFLPRSKPVADIYSLDDLAGLIQCQTSEVKEQLFTSSGQQHLPLARNLRDIKGSEGLIIGVNNYSNSASRIMLSEDSRKRHLYISGSTGSGKSTLLANLILQDVENNKGLTLIDPHGDLAKEVKARLPANRLKDLIYFDPSELNQPLRINLLELPAKSSNMSPALLKEQVTESLISLLRKVFGGDELSSHRIEYILRNTIQTALKIKGSNLFTIFKLLNDSTYRLRVVSLLKDPNLVNFWQQELGRAGDYQRVKMTAGVTSKIGRFLFSEPVKQVFDTEKSNLDFSKVINDQKIFIADLSKGSLGEDTSRLFAATCLTKLYLTGLNRANLNASERVGHYLYVDEFQSCAPNIISQMLSELRKYGLYLTMAEQSPSQQDTTLTSSILANVGNIICFRSASTTDAKILAYNFSDNLKATDLNNLPAFSFYLRSIGKDNNATTSGQTYALSKYT